MDQITTEKDISASECSSNSSWDESSTSVSSVSLKDSSRQFESTKITTEIIKLPKDLCEDQAIFREFFSLDTWNCLSNPIQKHLCSFLPMFTGTIDYEILNTIEALFSNKITRFDYCPLKKLQKDVEECYCKPEIALLHASVSKAERREQRFQECDRLGSLAHKVYVSREKVLQEVYHSAGYPILSQMYDPEDLIYSTTALRAKKRFLREIASVTEQFGGKDVLSDEDAGISNVLPRRQRRLFGTQQGCISSSGTDNRIANTFAYKDDHPTTGHLIGPNGKFFISDHYYRNILVCHKRRKIEEPDNPELDCKDIKLKDVVHRTQASSGYRRIMPLPKIIVPDDVMNCNGQTECCESTVLDVIAPVYSMDLPQYRENQPISDDMKKSSYEYSPKLNLINEETCQSNIIQQPSNIDGDKFVTEVQKDMSQNSIDSSFLHSENGTFDVICDDYSSFRNIEMKIDPSLKSAYEYKGTRQTEPSHDKNFTLTEKVENSLSNQSAQRTTFEEASLESSLSVTQQIVEISSYSKSMSEMMQETHKCFLSLVRDIFCSTPDHRMAIDELQHNLKLWLSTPISTLNDWYHLVEDKWDVLLQSAVWFLSGEFPNQPDDFVPYIEYKVQLNIYQWIGASRDSDHRLLILCRYWLGRKHEMGNFLSNQLEVSSSKQKCLLANKNSFVDDEDGSSEQTISPPPPRFPTDWSVRKATETEIMLFRDQEKRRYENPHMAFTYKQHFYNSVVGPVKGIYTQVPGISKARGHNMLIADRPNFVTILTLVRDATARLPNGEGTRADICELLKSSQYISPTATDQVLQTIVSGALDRMHTEHDPCVKYDTKRKIWIYLHRNRTEKEFEQLHHQYQGIAKHKKNVYRKSKFKDSSEISLSDPYIKSNSQSSFESMHSESITECSNISRNTVVDSVTSVKLSTDSSYSRRSPSINALESSIISSKILTYQSTISGDAFEELHTNKLKPDEEKVRKVSWNGEVPLETVLCNSSKNLQHINDTSPLRISSTCKIRTLPPCNAQPQIETVPVKLATTSNVSNPLSAISTPNPIIPRNGASLKPIILESIPTTVSASNSSTETLPFNVDATPGHNEGNRLIHNFMVPVSFNTDNVSNDMLNPPNLFLESINHSKNNSSSRTPTPVVLKSSSLRHTTNNIPLLTQTKDNIRLVHSDSVVVMSNKQLKNTSTKGVMQNDSEATVSRSKTGINIHPITDMNNTVSVANVQQSILTPAQQKQILQNLLAQQNKQVLVPRCLTGLQSVYTSTNTTSSNFIRGTKTVAKQLHEMSTLELSNLVSTPAVLLQSIDTDVASSHVFHIRPSNAIISGTTEANINMPNATQNETKHKQKFPISRYTIQNDELKILPSSKAVANQKPSSVLISSVTSETAITRAIKSATFVSQPALGTLRTSLTNNIGQNASQVTGKVVKTVGDCQISSLDSLLPQKRLSSEIGIRFAEQKTQSTHLENNLTNIDKNAVLTSNSSIISAVPSFNKDTTQVLVTSTANNLLGPKTAQVCNANQISTVDGMTMLGENENRLNKDTSSNTEHVFGKTTRTSRNIATTIGGTSCINSHSDLRLIEDNPILIASKSSVEIDAVQQKSSNIGFQKAISPSNLLNIRYSEQTKNVQGNITSQKLLLGNHLMKMRTVPRQHNQMQLSFSKQPSGDVAITSVPTSVHHLANISVKGVSPDHQEKSLFNTLSLKGSAATSGEETVSKVGIRMNQQMQRVVLASQGRHIVTQQIIVPSTFQTGPFNIKHLKVIPVNSQQKGSKVNSPSNVTVPHINSPTAITVSNAAGETSSEVIPIHNTSVSDSVDMSNAVELSHDSNSM
ncbi:uncharacterized protein LOC131693122 isoform X2 [Topomyia yanbarensis]|uniref:uncharacterized protein LOC131693122 isoform X2 n=1 Tax=Topomyia yanbarensis TaxID=2498891 RepID=UPI00273CCC7A|nr:uncharacterized protein LOC131693122 isoform X2 [Topomyia yanbarensis]